VARVETLDGVKLIARDESWLLFRRSGTEPIVRIYTSDPAVVPHGVACLRIVSYGFVFYAWGMVIGNSFNGAGDTWTPTVLNLFCFWMLELPLAWLLARVLGWGPTGVFWAITIAFSALAVSSALVFRRGRWKTRAVSREPRAVGGVRLDGATRLAVAAPAGWRGSGCGTPGRRAVRRRCEVRPSAPRACVRGGARRCPAAWWG
jgi:hypothetical protein